ncbi:MAG: PQQ-binding-like beta-propeller repeat protein [Planctomycetaceae bacterium]
MSDTSCFARDGGDPFSRDWSSNRIVAYDLQTGRERWRVGGKRLGEAFDLPLAGTYFFGAPTPADRELFVVGERAGELSLFVLDAETGDTIYVQPLAHPTAGIDGDEARRLWSCAPAVSEGVVVCPTSLGWLVAVDRLERRLLWAFGYTEEVVGSRQPRVMNGSTSPILTLNTRWLATPPIIAGRRVVATMQDLPNQYGTQPTFLTCLDLATGAEQWRLEKQDDDLYLAGVAEGQCLVVGRSRVQGIDLETGLPGWTLTLPQSVRPSGRGIIAGNALLLPLSNGELWSILSADGTIESKQSLPENSSAPGSLTLVDGVLISAETRAVRGFFDQSTLDREIARRRRESPDDPWVTLREARLHHMRHEYSQVVEHLTSGLPNTATLAPAEAAERDELLHSALVAMVTEDWQARDAEFARLHELNRPGYETELLRLSVERGLARREWNAVWTSLRNAILQVDPQAEVVSDELTVNIDVWLGGRLEVLYRQGTADLRLAMDEAFSSWENDAATDATPLPSHRLTKLLAFHPVGWRQEVKLAKQAADEQRLAEAELRWRRVWTAATPESAVPAGLSLAGMYAKAGFGNEATELVAQLRSRFNEALDPAAEESLRELDQLVQGIVVAAPVSPPPEWKADDIELVAARRVRQLLPVNPVQIIPADLPFFRSHPVRFDLQTQRLWIEDLRNGDQPYWSIPLRGPQRSFGQTNLGMRTVGLQGYTTWQDFVQSISLLDRQVGWSHQIDKRSVAGSGVRRPHANIDPTMHVAEHYPLQNKLSAHWDATGMLADATPSAVLVHGRRELLALDPIDGKPLWRRTQLPARVSVRVDADTVCVHSQDDGDPLLLSLHDGSKIDAATLNGQASHMLTVATGAVITLQKRVGGSFFGLLPGDMRLTATDLNSGEPRWTHKIAPNPAGYRQRRTTGDASH